jgi:hypothetical protein
MTESEEEEIPLRRRQPQRRATLRVRLRRLARGLDQDTNNQRRPPQPPPDAERVRLSRDRREPRDRFDERTNSRRAPSPPRDAGRSRIREAVPIGYSRSRRPLRPVARPRPPPPPPPAPGASAIPIPAPEPYFPPRLPPTPMDEAMEVARDVDRLKQRRLQPSRGPQVDILPEVPLLDHIERHLASLAQKINAPPPANDDAQLNRALERLENLAALAQGTSVGDRLDALSNRVEGLVAAQQGQAQQLHEALVQKPIPPDLSPQFNALRSAFEEQRRPDIAARLADIQNTITDKQFILPPDFLKPLVNQIEQIGNAVLTQERRVHDTLMQQGGLIDRLIQQGEEARRRKEATPMDTSSSTAPPPPPPPPGGVKEERGRTYIEKLTTHLNQLQETRTSMEALRQQFTQMTEDQRELAHTEKERAERVAGQLFGAQSKLHEEMTKMMKQLPRLLQEGSEKLRREEKLDITKLAEEVASSRDEVRDVKRALEEVSTRIQTVEPRLAERIKQERDEILQRHAIIKQERPETPPSAPPPAAELTALTQPLASPRPESTLLTYPPTTSTLLGPTEEQEVLERLALTHPVEAFQLKHPPATPEREFFERIRAPLQSIAEKPPHRPETPAHMRQPPIKVFEPPLGTQRPTPPPPPPVVVYEHGQERPITPASPSIHFGSTPTPPPAVQVSAAPPGTINISINNDTSGATKPKLKPKLPKPQDLAIGPAGQRKSGVREAAEDRLAATVARRQAQRQAQQMQRRPNTPIGRETPLDMLPYEPTEEAVEEDTEDEGDTPTNYMSAEEDQQDL